MKKRLLPLLFLTGTVICAYAVSAMSESITISEPPPVSGSAQPAPVPDMPESEASEIMTLPDDALKGMDVPARQETQAPAEKISAATDSPAAAELAGQESNMIVLQGLNKVTGHISRLEAPVGTVMRFGNLEIIGRRCWKSPPDEQPENAGLLEIWELRPGESHQRIFLGWIFSSSPGLSGLEHPVYDVTMIECLSVSDEAAESAEANGDEAAKSLPRRKNN